MLWLSLAFMLVRSVPDSATHVDARERTKTCDRDVHKGVESIGDDHPMVDVRPTLLLDVIASADIPRDIVARALSEATTIWEGAGIDIQRSSTALIDVYTIGVVIDDETGVTTHSDPALGWIRFGAPDEPERRVHLSRRNVKNLLGSTAGFAKRPDSEREMLVGRALGRTLAHELGHYLLRSKEHTPHGLMRASASAEDFFSPSRASFYLECDQMTLAAARFRNPSHTGIISRGTVDRWDLGAHRPQIARELTAVVDGIEQKAEEHVPE
jgi:hypothetical protein